MSKRSWLARLLVGGLLAGGLLFTQTAPAQADCVSATAYITRQDATPIWIWNGCVYPTDWPTGIENGYGDEPASDTVPTGIPNGFFVYVEVPVP